MEGADESHAIHARPVPVVDPLDGFPHRVEPLRRRVIRAEVGDHEVVVWRRGGRIAPGVPVRDHDDLATPTTAMQRRPGRRRHYDARALPGEGALKACGTPRRTRK